MSAPSPHVLTGAYAVHALAEPERAAFQRHLAVCPDCAREVAGFEAVLARMAAAEAVAPPPGLRSRVLAAIVPSLPAEGGPGPPRRAARPDRAPRRPDPSDRRRAPNARWKPGCGPVRGTGPGEGGAPP
ncbi:zf-HC2 domain-containing protein [Kitasatospora camelliae]|uniref:Zf-HC2 domain-containing protein n=1 Tax=Kitasatospora camelliae TaxID=3156397 RepID=A0AAU8K5Z8_9ACTN